MIPNVSHTGTLRPKRLLTVDVVRAIGAIAVYLSHVISLSLLPIPIPRTVQGFGVEIFYFVSGFVIGLTLLKASHWSPFHFLKRRMLRILPAYYVSILIVVGLINSVFLLSPDGLVIIAQHLVMLHGFHPEYRGAINGVYWMLGNIVWFYVLIAGLAPLLRSRWFGVLISAGFILCFGWRAIVFQSFPTLTNPDAQQYWATQLPGVLDIYLVGIACAWIYLYRSTQWGLFQLPYWKSLLAALIGMGTVAVALLAQDYSGAFLPLFVGWRTLLGIGIGIVVLGCIGFEKSRRFASFVRYSGLGTISLISYSIFLYHLPVINAFNGVIGEATIPLWALFGMMTGAVVLVATGSYYLVERRAMNIKHIPLFQWRRTYSHEYARQD